jgi:aminoglycoside phosphotransferase (APT) family kinase protein
MWLADAYRRRPLRVARHARIMAEQHRRIHAKPALAGLPSQRDILKSKILSADLDGAVKRSAIAILQRLPHGNSVCHGDFQPFSVQLTNDGPVISNWKDVCNGNPLCDVARTALIMTHSVQERGVYGQVMRNYLRVNTAFYLSAYLQRERGHDGELEAWMVVNAAARLCEDVPEKARLQKLIARKLPRVMARYRLPSSD